MVSGGGHYGLHHHHVSYVNDEAVKGLLVPLAGIALLGAAAIAASNPVLLQIGVIGGGIGKKRRKRAIPRIEDLKVLEKFLEQVNFFSLPNILSFLISEFHRKNSSITSALEKCLPS